MRQAGKAVPPWVQPGLRARLLALGTRRLSSNPVLPLIERADARAMTAARMPRHGHPRQLDSAASSGLRTLSSLVSCSKITTLRMPRRWTSFVAVKVHKTPIGRSVNVHARNAQDAACSLTGL